MQFSGRLKKRLNSAWILRIFSAMKAHNYQGSTTVNGIPILLWLDMFTRGKVHLLFLHSINAAEVRFNFDRDLDLCSENDP